VVASAETLAFAVATGTVGDPRSFKRPVRVTVPRALPTDDVLIVRERRGDGALAKRAPPPVPTVTTAWTAGASLELVEGLPTPGSEPKIDSALLLFTLDEVREAAARITTDGPVRAIIAPFIPSGIVPLFAGAGVLALAGDAATLRSLKGQKTIAISPVSSSTDGSIAAVTVNKVRVSLSWLAVGVERGWTLHGTSRPSPPAARARPL
jgi:aconitate hydratase